MGKPDGGMFSIRVARFHGVYDPAKQWWSIMRPIKHLARISLADAPTLTEIEKRTGFHFTPNSFPTKYISADDYQRIYDAIPWQWTIGDGPWTGAAPLPSAKPRVDPGKP